MAEAIQDVQVTALLRNNPLSGSPTGSQQRAWLVSADEAAQDGGEAPLNDRSTTVDSACGAVSSEIDDITATLNGDEGDEPADDVPPGAQCEVVPETVDTLLVSEGFQELGGDDVGVAVQGEALKLVKQYVDALARGMAGGEQNGILSSDDEESEERHPAS